MIPLEVLVITTVLLMCAYFGHKHIHRRKQRGGRKIDNLSKFCRRWNRLAPRRELILEISSAVQILVENSKIIQNLLISNSAVLVPTRAVTLKLS